MNPVPPSRYRLVGIGKCTKGVEHELQPGRAVVIGRQSDCTIVLTRTPEADREIAHISRQHAVIESDAQHRWIVRDAGSSNGTAVLRGGLLPAIAVAKGVRQPLTADDVIELAASDEFRFAFQAIPASEDARLWDGDGRTERLIVADRPCLQLIYKGAARQVVNVDAAMVTLRGADDGHAGPQGRTLPIPGLKASQIVATVGAGPRGITLTCGETRVLLNLKPHEPGQTTILTDGDLMTLPEAPDASVLFLDPRQTPVRKLSDLLADGDRVTIGTARDNSCRLVDLSLSKNHAVIWRENDRIMIRDLHSTNGTAIDGRRIVDAEAIQPGAQLVLGRLPFIADPDCWQAPALRPASIDVRFVGVSVEIAGKLRLRRVSFGVGHGEMIGLLGPSASGKSTLLKLLAGQYRLAEGEIYVNGRAMAKSQERRNWLTSLMGFRDETYEVGFVQQHDLVQPGLTVREILEYAARHMGLDPLQASKRAREAGVLCNLGPLMDRVVQLGNGQLNLSGGQLKRVCVAIEVLRQPRILVLDEPTTGQDPKNTDDLMHLFRSLAQEGVTLLISTHDLRNLALFDKVAVLCLGRLAYFGPPASFAAQFQAATAEDVYSSLPDRDARNDEAERLEQRFRGTPLYRRYCEADA
jgi:ABC-type multidrug transport system ATPase subunit/pSer/pThr/pTyr-binding forkhead associated (FHA) protein